MDNSILEREESRGFAFGGAVLSTVAIGVVMAGMAIYCLRAGPPPPPEKIIIKPRQLDRADGCGKRRRNRKGVE